MDISTNSPATSNKTDYSSLTESPSESSGGTATSTLVSELETTNESLLREVEKLKGELRAVRTAKQNRPGWRSRNGKRVKLSELSKEMSDNAYEIACVVKKILFPKMKFLRNNWEVYSENPRTWCAQIMRKMTLDETFDGNGALTKKDVWDGTLVKIIAIKYTMERNQSLQKMRGNFMSKYKNMT